MLTEPAYRFGSAAHLFPRADRRDPPFGPRSPTNSIEMMGSAVSFVRNAEIYAEREPVDYLYKVLSGTVRTYRALMDGRRQVGAFYLPGDIFGLESGEQELSSGEAVVDSTVMVVDRGIVTSLAACDRDVARQLWALMGRELERTQDRLLLLIKTAHERVASFLLEMAGRLTSHDEVELARSWRELGVLPGITIETGSRQLNPPQNASADALPTSKRIVLRDREVLKRLIA